MKEIAHMLGKWPGFPSEREERLRLGAFLMAAVAALLRPGDIRGPLVVLWAAAVLVIGGALTINPPFWPRIVIAFVPAAIAIAASVTWLSRALRLALGRPGTAVALAATAGLLAFTSEGQLRYLANYYRGMHLHRLY